jgi:hypothetical protein
VSEFADIRAGAEGAPAGPAHQYDARRHPRYTASGRACHMADDTALCFSGWFSSSVTTGPAPIKQSSAAFFRHFKASNIAGTAVNRSSSRP